MTNRIGRPSIFSKMISKQICARLSGGEPLRSICRDKTMPALSTVYDWITSGKQPEFSEQYRCARVAQGHHDADMIRELGLQVLLGTIDPVRAKVAMDAFKWSAERNAARVYGSKPIEEPNNSEGITQIKRVIVSLVDSKQSK